MKLLLLITLALSLQAQTTLTYCNFTSAVTPCNGSQTVDSFQADASGKFGQALRICKGGSCPGQSSISLTGTRLSMPRGSIVFWYKQNDNAATVGPPEIFNTYPANPYISGSFTPTTTSPSAQGNVFITHSSSATSVVGIYATPTTANFTATASVWHLVCFTWTGDHWLIYLDGVLSGTVDSQSPFPYTTTLTSFKIGTQAGGTQDISIDEFGAYDWAMSAAEVSAYYSKGSAGAVTPSGSHGAVVYATWGPGEKKVKYTIDSGPDLLATADHYVISVLTDGSTVASATVLAADIHNGAAEGLISIPAFPSGTYSLSVVVKDSGNSTLATVTSDSLVFTKPAWLGNAYGIDSSVPHPYFDDMTSVANDINVVNRTYSFSTGYGLPTQIVAAGQNMLSVPMALEVEVGGVVQTLSSKTVSVTSIAADAVSWTGSATAGSNVSVAIAGTCEYDGYCQISMTLAPIAGTQALTGVRLKTSLPSARAVYVHAVKDQPFWQYVYAIRVPTATGEWMNNLDTLPRPAATNNIFNTIFSDNDRGLQIAHENMAGWKIDENQPWQRYIRNGDGTVTYQCSLVNANYTLTGPITINFGLMATPAKRLPSTWRMASVGAQGGDNAPRSPWQFHFDFENEVTWKSFHLMPVDPSTYKTNTVDPVRSGNTKLLPFTNAHVFVADVANGTPSYLNPATAAEQALLNGETLHLIDGYNSSPSRGESDYWASALYSLLNNATLPNQVDGYYIDESYSYLPNASLLTGAGYIKLDGTHGYGQHNLGGRANFTRLAKILMAYGKNPNLWIHTTATMGAHMYTHAMATFDGEVTPAYADPTTSNGLDHMDFWNNNNSLLDATATGRGEWLLTTGASAKYGTIPTMWRGIDAGTYYAQRLRTSECMYQMLDILQQDQDLTWYQPKYSFSIGEPGVTFNSFVSQSSVTTDDAKVKVSYYKLGTAILAYIANFDTTSKTPTITLDLSALGARKITKAFDAETPATTFSVPSTTFSLTIPRHDCRVAWLSWDEGGSLGSRSIGSVIH